MDTPIQFIPEITESNLDSNVVAKLNSSGSVSANTFIPTQASDFTSPNTDNIGKIWELTTTIDLGGADVDLSAYGITLKDSGGLITNFRTFNLGDFRTEQSPYATYFDQYDGTTNGYIKLRTDGATVLTQPTSIIVSVIGNCLDEVVYVNWFSPHKNADLIVGGTLNGALPDHVAIQNAIAVTPKTGGTLSFPANAWLMMGDATNPEYNYTDTPYLGDGVTVSCNTDDDDYVGVNQALVFEDFNNLKILGNGVTLLVHPDQSKIVNNKGFYFKWCTNLHLSDLTYDGNSEQRDPYQGDRNPFNLQSNFTFGGCVNPILERVISQKSVMDGFIYGAFGGVAGSYGSQTDCKALYNYRQGMSIVSHSYLKFNRCHFSYTGRLTSTTGTADGRWLTTSPSAGVDMEAGGSGTAPDQRGQFDTAFYDCVFEQNYGDGLADHWGSTRTLVEGCSFIKNTLFSPQDSVPETCGNSTYRNNKFINSSVNLAAGGVHFIGNIFYQDEYLQAVQDKFPPYLESNNKQLIVIVDGGYGSYYASGYQRQTIIKDNFIKIVATSDNFPIDTLKLGRITINAEGAIFENNRIVNGIAIDSVGVVGTLADIGNLTQIGRIKDNVWLLTDDARTKYSTSVVGRVSLNAEEYNTPDNSFHSIYAFSKRYMGGLKGTTAERPDLGYYTIIDDGADYYDTTTGTMVYWNGSAFD